MKVSVIVPVRDEEDSIRELLDSLLAQTRPPDEIVITDGGSVDATPQIIEDYKQRGAPVHLIRAEARPTESRHELIELRRAHIKKILCWRFAMISGHMISISAREAGVAMRGDNKIAQDGKAVDARAEKKVDEGDMNRLVQ